ncbi:MAG: hypothetical protein CVV32_05780 [Methanomicrobiales archaeon HGW-Methanomicrobiales-3]|nr:MAG: hypothetical protein CVV32_05780 [Methanomicrobiales archaeon HGW-Methanomicrobiales-3]
MVLYHILKEIPRENYCLITMRNFHQYGNLGNCSKTPGGKMYFLFPDYQVIRFLVRIAMKIHSSRLLDLLLKIRTYQIKKIIQREKCSVLIGCTGELFDPPATCRAAKELGISFYLYAFDLYSSQFSDPHLAAFSKKREQEMMQYADRIIVPNECMQKIYYQKYGVNATVIHNPCDIEEYERFASSVSIPASQGKKIVYTGGIYDAHFSAFHNLLAAIDMTGIADMKLHIYSPQSPRYLKKNGICGPVIIHEHLPNNQVPAIQRDADILFLPLAFNSPYPEVIKTSAPGKTAEYLLAKKPILVHAPADSFISWYFRKYTCGYVVDEDDKEKLSSCIINIFKDDPEMTRIAENAYSRGIVDFNLTSMSKRFHDLIK